FICILKQELEKLIEERKKTSTKFNCWGLFIRRNAYYRLDIVNTYSGKSILGFTIRTFVRIIFLR
ncbi:hypothetical protein DUY31_13800, partial [Enterococcus faecium]|nr:hypothetical protein [Enterococcus faecium]